MPEVVQAFADNRDFNEVRTIQRRILSAYEQDFSKHAPNEAVPSQTYALEQHTRSTDKGEQKFIYGLIKEGARAKEYELARQPAYRLRVEFTKVPCDCTESPTESI